MLVTIDHLKKIYNKKKIALNNINCTIEKQKITGIVGPNGSGKTTFLNCLLDIVDCTEGQIRWNMNNRNRIILIPDENLLPDLLTGMEYILFLSKLFNTKLPPAKDALIEQFEMTSDIHKSISQYSYGMKKKIQLLSAYLVSPELLILDEPFRGLDIEAIVVTKKMLKSYILRGGSIILSSHDILAVEQLCDHVIMLYSGEIKADGVPSQLIDKYKVNSLEEVFMTLRGREINEEDIWSLQYR